LYSHDLRGSNYFVLNRLQTRSGVFESAGRVLESGQARSLFFLIFPEKISAFSLSVGVWRMSHI